MKLLAFAASLRAGSYNKLLIRLAADAARRWGAEVDLADFREFDMPLFDGDIETKGPPAGAVAIKRRIEAVDGLILASPEYNFSIGGPLKNAIDWISRLKPQPLRGKSALLIAASTSVVGGIRGLWQARIPLEGLGVFVHPDMFTVPSAAQAFDEHGALKDAKAAERLEKLMAEYFSAARALAERRSPEARLSHSGDARGG